MNPDDMPSPEEERLMLATMRQDSATALRLVSAMAEGDRDAVAMQLEEIAECPQVSSSGRTG